MFDANICRTLNKLEGMIYAFINEKTDEIQC